MNRKERRRAEAQRRKMDIQSMIHDNKDIGIVTDLSGTQPIEPLEAEGILTEDPKVTTIDGDQAIVLIAQCGDLGVHGVIMKPTARGLAAGSRLKKGMRVRLGGHFSPTNFERHEGTDILKPFGGIMMINKVQIIREEPKS
jgi:hypothetical protein